MSIEEMWEEIHGKLCKVSELVPESYDFSNKGCHNMPWINSSLKRAIRVKNKSWKLFDVCPIIDNLNEALLKHSNLVVKEIF